MSQINLNNMFLGTPQTTLRLFLKKKRVFIKMVSPVDLKLDTTNSGAYGPLVLAPMEGLGALWTLYFNNNCYLHICLYIYYFPQNGPIRRP